MTRSKNKSNDTLVNLQEIGRESRVLEANIYGGSMVFILLFSLVFNMYALQHVMRQKSRLKFIHVVLASLFVSNFLQATLGYPIELLWIINMESAVLVNHGLCQFRAYVVFATSVISIEHVVLLSLHRFIQFAFPMIAKLANGEWQKALLVTVIAWLLGLFQCAFPFFGWGRFGSSNGYTCGIDFRDGSVRSYTFLAYSFLIFYVLPIVILTTTSFLIQHRYADHFRRLPRRFQKRYKNIEVAMLISFIVCWTPYAIVSLLTMTSLNVSEVERFCGLFAKLSSIVNSLVYCCVYRVWKKEKNATNLSVDTLDSSKQRTSKDHYCTIHDEKSKSRNKAVLLKLKRENHEHHSNNFDVSAV